MLQSLILQHHAMRDQLPTPSSRHLHHHDSHKIDISVRNELSVLRRNTITRQAKRAKLAPIGRTQHVEHAKLVALQEHQDKMHFEHVILARFTIKCAHRHERYMSQRGRALGISIFQKLKIMSTIKRRLRNLMSSTRLGRLRNCWLQWYQRLKYKQDRRRYMYSIVRTRHLHRVKRETETLCINLWRSYTKRLQKFRHRLWRIALDIQRITRVLAGWRVEIVRSIKLRHLLQRTLATKQLRIFLSWNEQIKKQLEVRRNILQKMRHRVLATGYKTWVEKVAAAKVVAVNMQRLFYGKKGRRRHAAQRNVLVWVEELRTQEEEEACQANEKLMEEKLLLHLNTFRGRISLHQMFVVIRQLDSADGRRRSSVMNMCRSYAMARSALLKGGRRYARREAAIRFQLNQPPKQKCLRCTKGFALLEQLLKHESRGECATCWWSDKRYDEDESVVTKGTTSHHHIETKKKDDLVKKILEEVLCSEN